MAVAWDENIGMLVTGWTLRPMAWLCDLKLGALKPFHGEFLDACVAAHVREKLLLLDRISSSFSGAMFTENEGWDCHSHILDCQALLCLHLRAQK